MLHTDFLYLCKLNFFVKYNSFIENTNLHPLLNYAVSPKFIASLCTSCSCIVIDQSKSLLNNKL